MEAQLEILVVGTHREILATVLRLLNAKEDWNATGVGSADEVLNKCREKEYQVLLLGAGLKEEVELSLTREVKFIYPDIHVIPHYGGGSGLLYAEIYLAIQS
ncbi:hypothetical protein ACSBL2_12620 [Pedobacter sp. AW31-3R]|uniref:hypothetical protein n=1 Tax=Pedobacter sp. AW31-3R TaxID=3445781 RepID=UPI003F9F5CEA